MKILSKRLREEKKKFKNNFFYDIKKGIKIVKSTTSAKFNETIEAHISLNLDPRYSDQQLRTTLILPHGTGKPLRIAALVTEERVLEAQKAGADVYGGGDLIDNISKGNLNFDLLVATADMMPKLAKLGRILGPKGLMPSPKAGTVTTNLQKTINEFKKGKIEYRADKTGSVHLSIGKDNFSEQQLTENLYSFFNSVTINKPSGVKGNFIKKLTLCSTMGPGIAIDFKTLNNIEPNIIMETKKINNIQTSVNIGIIGEVDTEKTYTIHLQMKGIGYHADLVGNRLRLKLGFTHIVTYPIANNIKIKISKHDDKFFTIEGVNKKDVELLTARLLLIPPRGPYKPFTVKQLFNDDYMYSGIKCIHYD
jgi:large subunit ribosomal protein L1